MSKNSPEKGPICLSSPEVHKCDFELCTDALVCMKRIGHSIFVIICMKSYQINQGPLYSPWLDPHCFRYKVQRPLGPCCLHLPVLRGFQPPCWFFAAPGWRWSNLLHDILIRMISLNVKIVLGALKWNMYICWRTWWTFSRRETGLSCYLVILSNKAFWCKWW